MHWMDRVQVWALKKRHCFKDGWGDLSVVDHVCDSIENPGPILPLDLSWTDPTLVLGAELRLGSFTSPVPALAERVAQGRVWWLHPADQDVRGMVVAFASWGDEGPTLRGRILGPLVREGVSIVILENPYYGVRRPEGQIAGGLRTVEDFIRMQGTVFEEGRALLSWAQRTVDAPVAVFGFSMGGHIGATVTTAMRNTPLVVAAPPLCPSEPMSEGPLSVCLDWDALGGRNPKTIGRWIETMDRFDLRQLPAPRRPELTRVIGCSQDGLVPATHALEIAEHWALPFEWQQVGHVGVVLTRGRVLRRALRDVMGIPQRGRRPALLGAVETSRTG